MQKGTDHTCSPPFAMSADNIPGGIVNYADPRTRTTLVFRSANFISHNAFLCLPLTFVKEGAQLDCPDFNGDLSFTLQKSAQKNAASRRGDGVTCVG